MPDDSLLTPSLVRRGARETVVAAGRSLRAMDRDRRAALGAALAMLVVLLAPWYEVVATARGADGARHALRQPLSGWQALSLPGVVCAAVAVATAGLLLVRSGTPLQGLGVEGRRAARARLDGGLIAAGGALAVLIALIGIAVHPAPHVALAGVTAATSVRYGLVLGLLVAIVIAALGARIALAAGDDASLRSWPKRPRAVPRRHTGAASSAPPDPARTGEEMPQFDFVLDRAPRVSRPPVARRTRTARSRSR